MLGLRSDQLTAQPLKRKLARGLIAILAGISSGAVLGVFAVAGPVQVYRDAVRALNVSYHFLLGHMLYESIWDTIAVATWEASLIYSSIVGLVAIPIWIGLGRIRRNRIVDALLLGAALGGSVGYVFENGGPLWALKFGVVGACAGLVTWTVSHRAASTQPART